MPAAIDIRLAVSKDVALQSVSSMFEVDTCSSAPDYQIRSRGLWRLDVRTVSASVLCIIGIKSFPYLPQKCWTHLECFNGKAKRCRGGERAREGDVAATGVLVKSQSKGPRPMKAPPFVTVHSPPKHSSRGRNHQRSRLCFELRELLTQPFACYPTFGPCY